MLTMEHTTAEKLKATITATADPTGSDVEFNLTAATASSPGDTWTAGTWGGDWDATTGKVVAWSPVMNATGFTLTEDTRHRLWVRWTQGSETPVHMALEFLAT